jgi:aminoglycoside phosphotransferase (APT) family kinase protein
VTDTEALLHELVARAGLPEVTLFEQLRGHGFDHEILRATLADSQQVVLRHQEQEPRQLPLGQARFLAEHDVPAPALLGGNEFATLYEYVPGDMLSALVAEDRMTDDKWRSAGTAFRRLHAVRFPKGVKGVFGPDELVLRPADPATDLHEMLVEAEPNLKVNVPFVLPHLPRLHEVIDDNAEALREAPTALLHWDVYPANVIVGPAETTLIDWGEPRVGDPAKEIAALDEHIHLINGSQLPEAFFETYGPRSQPNTAIHRLTGAIGWFSWGPFAGWEIDPDLSPTQTTQVTNWRTTLVSYLTDIGERLKEF